MEHYKMYKAGKNWMVAGLMTTAVLAGLTLSNVNNTASADANTDAQTTAVAATSATPATSAQISAAQENVANTSTAASNANVALSNAQSNFDSLNAVNSDVAAVNSAEQAYNAASDALTSATSASTAASDALTSAQTNYTNASNAAEYGLTMEDGTIYGGAAAASNAAKTVNSLSAELEKVQSKLAADSANLKSAQAAVDSKTADLATLKQQLQANIANWQTEVSSAQSADSAAKQAMTDAAAKSDSDAYSAAASQAAIADQNLAAAQAGLAQAQASWKINIDDVMTPLNNAVLDYQARVNLDNDAIYNPAKDFNYADGNFNGVKVLEAQLKNEQGLVNFHNDLVQKANEAKTKLDAAKSANTVAQQNLTNAQKALESADDAVAAVRTANNLPNKKQLAALEGSMNQWNNVNLPAAKSALENDAAYAGYQAASQAVTTEQSAVNKAQTAADAAAKKVSDLEAQVAKDKEAVAAAKDEGAKAVAQAQLAHDQSLLNDAKNASTAAQTTLNAANDKLSKAQAALKTATTADLQKKLDAYSQAQSMAATTKAAYESALKNVLATADITSQLDQAQLNLNAAKAAADQANKEYQAAKDELAKLEGTTTETSANKYGDQLVSNGTTDYTTPAAKAANASASANAAANDDVTTVVPAPTPAEVAGSNVPVDVISSVVWTDPAFINDSVAKGAGTYPTQVTVNFTDGSSKTISWNLVVKTATSSDNQQPTNPDNQQPSTPSEGGNNGQTSSNTGSNTTVAPNYTGVQGNNYYVNGQQVTKAQYEAHVAANTNKSQSANAAALPQTGNENSAAVMALGAVSAMFGLGLAAKKREF